MDHKRRVPEDLMGTILGASSGVAEVEHASPQPGPAPGDASWEENPERVGVAFNLSKQVSTELERIRLELEEDTHSSKSEIVEVALRIAAEDVWSRGHDSELVKRLEERHAAQPAGAAGDVSPGVVRSVDQTGIIIETTYGEGGEILDEEVIGSVADLPVVDEYVDEQGRLVSQAKDELGNTFEQILDNDLNTLGIRLLDG